jgi:hypothetical protein
VAVWYLVVRVVATQRFFVDEAGDGVLFGPQGRTTAVTPIMIVASTSGRLIHGPTRACK